MNASEMLALVHRHLKAEGAGDLDECIAVYTDDIEHDAVGFPGAPMRGKDAARAFYHNLTQNFRAEHEEELHRYVSENALTLEAKMTGVVTGSIFGLPGHGRRVTVRILHVFEFRDGRISRENVWLDSATLVQQLSA